MSEHMPEEVWQHLEREERFETLSRLDTLLKSASKLPGGLLSGTGIVLTIVVFVNQIMPYWGGRLGTAEYISTLAVSAILTLSGPLIIASENSDVRKTAADVRRSLALQSHEDDRASMNSVGRGHDRGDGRE